MQGRALIIGGSLSGLFAALLLRSRGWEVDVYERAETELAGRGAGIVTHQMLWDALDAMGSIGATISASTWRRVECSLLMALILEFACPQTMTAWDRVYAMLREAYPTQNYHCGKELARIQQCDDEVTAIFADGTSVSGDLLVGCDGLRSTVRAGSAGGSPIYAGYAAWRGHVPESASRPTCTISCSCTWRSACRRGEMLGYPVAGPGNDASRTPPLQPRLVRPAETHTALTRLLTAARGVTHRIRSHLPRSRARLSPNARGSGARARATVSRVLAHGRAAVPAGDL